MIFPGPGGGIQCPDCEGEGKVEMIENDIRQEFRKHFRERFNQVGLFEFGIKEAIFDAFIIQSGDKKIRGFEFKVSRRDFLSDNKLRPTLISFAEKRLHPEPVDHLRTKWEKYLKFVNIFYWVCPEGLIQPNEVKEPAGLIWVPGMKIKKRPKSINKDFDVKLLQEILFLFASRTKTRTGDYF